MSYRLQRTRPVVDSVRLIGQQQARAARAALSRPADREAQLEAVHQARTALKKLRALLRLVEPAMGAAFAREDETLRRLARTLAPVRDAVVLLETIDRLRADPAWTPARRERKSTRARQRPARLDRLRRKAKRDLQAAHAKLQRGRRLHRLSAALAKFERRAKHWQLVPAEEREGGWNLIADGLTASYGRAAQGMATAVHGGADHDFHDWRSAIKTHAHQLRLLVDCGRVELLPRLKGLDELGRLLGQDHDLAKCAQLLHDKPGWVPRASHRGALLSLLRDKQRGLRNRAFALGDGLLAASAADFALSVQRFWRVWRGVPQPEAPRQPPRRPFATQAAIAGVDR